MRVPQPIPYQGSKRKLAPTILRLFPEKVRTLIEPFAGSAAVSIAAAARGKCDRFHLNDLNEPLMALWDKMIHAPNRIARQYEKLWLEQEGNEKEFYSHVRDRFNQTHRPHYLLYLLARCVKASVRYNADGEFNQSPDNRRKGRRPGDMRSDILAVSDLFKGRADLTHKDYKEVFALASRADLVYMDPPYQGTCRKKDPRYYVGISFDEFALALDDLRRRNISFILSYDGRTGEKTYGKELPQGLKLHRIEIDAGRSSQATLLGRSDVTYESLYLSPALVRQLDVPAERLVRKPRRQLSLPGILND